jgi:hypothetical protein
VNNLQAEEVLKALEVVVPVKKFVAFLDAEGGDQAVDGLAHGDPAPLEYPEVFCGLHSESRRHFLKNRECQKPPLRLPKMTIGTKSA